MIGHISVNTKSQCYGWVDEQNEDWKQMEGREGTKTAIAAMYDL